MNTVLVPGVFHLCPAFFHFCPALLRALIKFFMLLFFLKFFFKNHKSFFLKIIGLVSFFLIYRLVKKNTIKQMMKMEGAFNKTVTSSKMLSFPPPLLPNKLSKGTHPKITAVPSPQEHFYPMVA